MIIIIYDILAFTHLHNNNNNIWHIDIYTLSFSFRVQWHTQLAWLKNRLHHSILNMNSKSGFSNWFSCLKNFKIGSTHSFHVISKSTLINVSKISSVLENLKIFSTNFVSFSKKILFIFYLFKRKFQSHICCNQPFKLYLFLSYE